MFKFKKPFDRKNGEDRVCTICGKGFHTMKPTNRCPPCVNVWTKNRNKEKLELGLIQPTEFKDRYPFDTTNGDAANRFKQIQKALLKCKTKEERKAHYDKQLKEAEELGIMKWIYDRRDAETFKENRIKTRGRIDKDMPDTRYMDWDDFERDGWGEPEDS